MELQIWNLKRTCRYLEWGRGSGFGSFVCLPVSFVIPFWEGICKKNDVTLQGFRVGPVCHLRTQLDIVRETADWPRTIAESQRKNSFSNTSRPNWAKVMRWGRRLFPETLAVDNLGLHEALKNEVEVGSITALGRLA